MNQPLGKAVGNALEVEEALQTLKGSGPRDVTLLCEKLASRMLSLNGAPMEASAARTKVAEALSSGRALEKFAQMVEAQGGDPRVIDTPALLPQAALQRVIESPFDGFATSVNAGTVGRVSMALGAGRETVDSRIDSSVGILLNKKVGDRVEKGEPLCTVFYNQAAKFESVQQRLLEAFVIAPDRVEPPPLIKRVVE
jgi:thymidine phosphorylase